MTITHGTYLRHVRHYATQIRDAGHFAFSELKFDGQVRSPCLCCKDYSRLVTDTAFVYVWSYNWWKGYQGKPKYDHYWQAHKDEPPWVQHVLVCESCHRAIQAKLVKLLDAQRNEEVKAVQKGIREFRRNMRKTTRMLKIASRAGVAPHD